MPSGAVVLTLESASTAPPAGTHLLEYAIYKPNSRNTGGVIRFGLNPAKAAVFVSRQEPDRAPYLMSVSRQENADKSVRKITIPVTHAEAAILETALLTAVTCLLGW